VSGYTSSGFHVYCSCVCPCGCLLGTLYPALILLHKFCKVVVVVVVQTLIQMCESLHFFNQDNPCAHSFSFQFILPPNLDLANEQGEPTASSYTWTGWAWELTGWSSSRLQENYQSFKRIDEIYLKIIKKNPEVVNMYPIGLWNSRILIGCVQISPQILDSTLKKNHAIFMTWLSNVCLFMWALRI
jgi:hypothetical protein